MSRATTDSMRGSPQGRPFEVGDDDRRPTL